MYDQEYRLGVRIDTTSVDPATAKIRALQRELKELEQSTSFSGYAARRQQLETQINTATRAMGQFKTQAVQMGQASGNAAYGMLTLANSVQDFEAAGVRGVLNNIPMLVQAIGGGAGLAGTVMIAAVAFQALSTHAEAAGKAIADAFSHEGTGQKRFKQLADDAKAATDAMFAPSDANAKEQSGVLDTLRNAPGGVSGIAEQLAKRLEERSGLGSFRPEGADSLIKMFEGQGKPGLAKRAREAAEKEARAEAKKFYEDQLRILAADPSRREQLKALVGSVSPDAAQALPGRNEVTAGTEEMAAAAKRNYAKEQAKLAEDLTKQGQENERLGRAIAERTEAELRAKEAAERHSQMQRREQIAKESGGGPIPFLAEQIASLTLGRQFGGEGLSMGEALDFKRQQIAEQAMTSQAFGGLGMNAETAMRYATQQVNAAYGNASQLATQIAVANPDSRELARQNKELVSVQRRMLTEGIPIRVRRIGWR
jgi:hypothetical protein